MTLRTLAIQSSILALAAFTMTQQSSHAQSSATARAVPISQEHHHHLVFENSFVRAYEFAVPPREATLLHKHDPDYVYVVFGKSDLTNMIAGQDPTKLLLADGSVNFTRGPLTHSTRNDGSATFFGIVFELLRTQGEEHTFFPTIDAALNGNAQQEGPRRDPNGTKEAVVLETDECRVSAVSILENSAWEPADTGHDRLVVMMDQFANTAAPREHNAPMFASGILKWLSARAQFTQHNRAMGEMKLLVLEFKDSK